MSKCALLGRLILHNGMWPGHDTGLAAHLYFSTPSVNNTVSFTVTRVSHTPQPSAPLVSISLTNAYYIFLNDTDLSGQSSSVRSSPPPSRSDMSPG